MIDDWMIEEIDDLSGHERRCAAFIAKPIGCIKINGRIGGRCVMHSLSIMTDEPTPSATIVC